MSDRLLLDQDLQVVAAQFASRISIAIPERALVHYAPSAPEVEMVNAAFAGEEPVANGPENLIDTVTGPVRAHQ